MGVLRVSFLSSLALELLATLSVALVAVSVGLRLAEGQITYPVALFVLLLAPEAYLPLRLVGQHFHAAAEGLGAADRVFTILETPVPVGGTLPVPAGALTVVVDDLVVSYPGRSEPALGGATFTAQPGTVTAVVGGSGGGKSTLRNAILGFVVPTSGSVAVRTDSGEAGVRDLDLGGWRHRLAWLPQRAHLPAADLAATPTIRDAVTLGSTGAGDDEVWRALTDAGIADDVRALPDGLAARLAADGTGLSVGQQQRLCLARALLTSADVVLLDEPTAALDPATESAVAAAIQRLAHRGATVIVVAHRPALVEIAHQIVRLDRVGAVVPSIGEHRESTSAEAIRRPGWWGRGRY
jgi:ATP-binding cassette subfamily C protein CydCD